MCAPRALACSYSSSTSTPAPLDRTNPSRSSSQGRLAASGSSLRVDMARAEPKPAIAVGKQRQAFESQHDGGVEIGIDPTGEDAVIIAALQTFDRQPGGHRGRGTGGVHDKIGTVAAERVGNPPGDDVGQQTGDGVFIVLGNAIPDLFRQTADDGFFNAVFDTVDVVEDALNDPQANPQDVLHLPFTGKGAQDDPDPVAMGQ